VSGPFGQHVFRAVLALIVAANALGLDPTIEAVW
jgi:hypothetical protein